jgi:hypothetical protein
MKKQDFIDYKEAHGLSYKEMAAMIGISSVTLWLFLTTCTKRKRSTMFALKKFYSENIENKKPEIKYELQPQLFNTEEAPKKEEVDQFEVCAQQLSFDACRFALEVCIQALKNQNVITQETFDSLLTYCEGMENAYLDAIGADNCE